MYYNAFPGIPLRHPRSSRDWRPGHSYSAPCPRDGPGRLASAYQVHLTLRGSAVWRGTPRLGRRTAGTHLLRESRLQKSVSREPIQAPPTNARRSLRAWTAWRKTGPARTPAKTMIVHAELGND